jgi:DNA-binding transcriptional regulator LsrR (DeoR family)
MAQVRGPNKVESLAAALGGGVVTVVVAQVTMAHAILERA